MDELFILGAGVAAVLGALLLLLWELYRT